jgi:hypothetical protein
MFELAESDKRRKSKKIKWDMYYLHMGWTYPIIYESHYKKKEKVAQNENDHFEII